MSDNGATDTTNTDRMAGTPYGDGRDLMSLIAQASADAGATTSPDEMFILLVPARLRSYVEREVLKYLRDSQTAPGVTVSVHSFSSLVRSVIGNRYDGRYAKSTLSMFALRELLAQRMHDAKAKEMLRSAGNTFGSIDQYANQIAELVNAGVTSHDVLHAAGKDQRMTGIGELLSVVESDPELADKVMNDRVISGGEARTVIPWAEDQGSKVHVYLYGFERLSAAEACAVDALCRHAQVTLLDEPHYRPDIITHIVESHRGHDGSACPGSVRILQSPESSGEETDRHESGNMLPDVLQLSDRVTVQSVLDPVSELQAAASRIDKLHKNGIPYGDILVTARDLEPYRALLGTEFKRHSIPVNASPVATLADQPFGRLLSGLLDDRLYGTYADDDEKAYKTVPDTVVVMRVLRAALLCFGRCQDEEHADFPFTESELDLLENRLRSENLMKLWNDGDDGTVRNVRALLDEARPVFVPGDDDARSVREALSDMVKLLVDWHVNMPPKDEGGNPANFKTPAVGRTAWMLVMREFDDLVTLLGDRPFSDVRESFAKGLSSIFESQPADADTKTFDAVDMVAFPTPMRHYAHVIMLGCSEDAMPAVPHESGLLDDTERRRLAESLEDNGKPVHAACLRMLCVGDKARREILSFNRILTHADSITFLCPSSVNGVSQSLSAFVAKQLPKVKVEAPDKDEYRYKTLEDLPSAETGPQKAESHSAGAISRTDAEDRTEKHDAPLNPDLALELFTRKVRRHDYSTRDEPEATRSSWHLDGPDPDRVLAISVSAAEQYYGNPFETFLQRGLRLRPIKPFTLGADIEGSFYHAVLERVIDARIDIDAAVEAVNKEAKKLHWDSETADSELRRVIPACYRRANSSAEIRSNRELIELFSELDFVPEPVILDARGGSVARRQHILEKSLLDEHPEFGVLDIRSYRTKAVHDQFVQRLVAFSERLDAMFAQWKAYLSDGDGIINKHAPWSAEQQFGTLGKKLGAWPAIVYRITGTSRDEKPVNVDLLVRGKVDRIDFVKRNGHKGFVVLDYKSSGKTLFEKQNGSTVFYGHELQLLTYAHAAEQNLRHNGRGDKGDDAPAVIGVSFVPIKESGSGVASAYDTGCLPVINESDEGVRAGSGAGNHIELFRNDGSGRAGIVCTSVVQPLDIKDRGCIVEPWRMIDPKTDPVKTKTIPSVAQDQKQFESLLKFVQRKIREAGQAMLAGHVEVSPYLTIGDQSNENGTAYSDFLDVMALDLLDENIWRYESPVSLDQLIEEATDGGQGERA